MISKKREDYFLYISKKQTVISKKNIYMKIYRIKAIFLRTLISSFRGFDTMVDFLYWPLYDILLWGFTSRWIQSSFDTGQTSLTMLGALVLWQAVYRGNIEISYNLLSELWSRNIVNLFATPITLTDWIFALMGASFFTALVAISVGSLAVFFLYGINIISLGFVLIPFLASLLISGWAIGFLTGSLLIYLGQKAQRFVWIMAWFFTPFCGIFYPISVLPNYIQYISNSLPITYIFEGFRFYVVTNIFPINYILISFLLNAIYLSLALLIFYISFKKSKLLGLSRLESD